MTASADIQTNTKDNVLAVPLNAVTTREKTESGKKSSATDAPVSGNPADDEAVEEVVFVIGKDKKVKKVKVKTAIQDLNYIEILDGLNEGDQVVTGPYNTVSKILKEGNLVQVVAKDKLFEEKKKE
ncbi:Multidrug resistance protein MdtA [compost metagenome]